MVVRNKLHICDFCGKSQKAVKKMVSSEPRKPCADICDECIDLCTEILYEAKYDFGTLQIIPKDVVQMLGFKPIFQARDFKSVEDTCFYLGPFNEPFNTIYKDHIVPPLKNVGFTVNRGDEIFSTDVIIEDVWKGIVSASFIVADVSGRNPNVMYEIGMAHTVGRPVLLMSQSVDDLPFDLRHRRCVIYSYTPRGCRKLEEDLVETTKLLRSLSSHPSS
jgi:hypothetical protein